MAEKLHEYEGVLGRVHAARDWARGLLDGWRESRGGRPLGEWLAALVKEHQPPRGEHTPVEAPPGILADQYAHIYRRKTRAELVRVSAAVMGIEFSYAAETAFVSPTLLKIGVEHRHMTLVWALSPLVGFFLTPVLGSLSDRCRLPVGRRRPFIVILAVGVLVGLILVPNGEDMGHSMGDYYPSKDLPAANRTALLAAGTPVSDAQFSHPWGVFFTILGTVLLDFDADACQSPARAYLLDVTVAEDHARGLSTFTIMAGLGGFLGYGLGGINWDATAIGEMLGGHVRAVFTLITFIFVTCVAYTVTSFQEVPLDVLEQERRPSVVALNQRAPLLHRDSMAGPRYGKMEDDGDGPGAHSYGATGDTAGDAAPWDPRPPGQNASRPDYLAVDESQPLRAPRPWEANGAVAETSFDADLESSLPRAAGAPRPAAAADPEEPATLFQYLLSIVYMPHSVRMVCLTNLFCWSAHVCYSLYFTDFVGEAVFGGEPQAPDGSESKELYEAGVRFGCWGMSMYSLSCACYSLVIERLIRRFGARRVYVGGLLFYSVGMFLMALTQHPVGVILFSWTAGVMYSTLFTMPYLLIAHYHACGTFEVNALGEAVECTQLRGLGTDVAIVSSMVFLAQFALSVCMGTLISIVGSTVTVVAVASSLAFCGAIAATRVMYLDL
ncbi:membrane-associated transporter protein [Frankliniella occidentalis]|uniref:Membrane-associated transporter protein n=1 Tax=Frankliniella occidentalis TaxID=133901 RepID=A0A9C6U4S3_FRAOC|nr:membrane-associated transporter protein [Frankliniella occidentalis]